MTVYPDVEDCLVEGESPYDCDLCDDHGELAGPAPYDPTPCPACTTVGVP